MSLLKDFAEVVSISMPFLWQGTGKQPKMNRTRMIELLIMVGAVLGAGYYYLGDVHKHQAEIIAEQKKISQQMGDYLSQIAVWQEKLGTVQKTTEKLEIRFDRVERDLYAPGGYRDHWGYRDQGTLRNGPQRQP